MKRGDDHSEILHELRLSPTKRMGVFRHTPVNSQGFILLDLSKRFQQDILGQLEDNEIINLLHYLDPNKVTDLLQNLDAHRGKKILRKLSEDIKEKVEFLLKFNPKTAAGVMSLDYIAIDKNLTFEQISKIIQKHERSTGKIPAMLVVEAGFLVGELTGYSLALHKGKEKIADYIQKVPHINYDKDQSEVVSTFRRHPHNKIVVLDDDDSILGVIYSDDILKLVQKQSLNNLRDFAGVSEEEDVHDSALTKVKYRYKWLIINLGTAFLAAAVVGLFKDVISAFVLLAVYMPIVAGMGGNAGTQTLAVIIRGIALKEVDLKTGKKVILNEMLAGVINGVINGVLVAVIAFLWNKSPLLGLIIGVSIVVNLAIAGFFGALIPMVMKSLGKDPASSATIFITTATDVFGFFVFLGLASLVL